MRQDYNDYAAGGMLDLQINNLFLNDLNIKLCGRHYCNGNHSWGYGVRDSYFLHFVIGGRGEFTNPYGSFQVQKGQGFVFAPDEKILYSADKNDPWRYIWIAFRGEKAKQLFNSCSFSSQNPIFEFENNFDIEKIFNEARELNEGRELYLISALYLFFSLYSVKAMHRLSKTDIAINYILQNYSNNITVENVARFVGFERKYFSRIFTEKTGITPVRYIINTRMNAAAELLRNTDLSISEIAYSVGYNDLPTFSKAFKQIYHTSPVKYARSQADTNNNR